MPRNLPGNERRPDVTPRNSDRRPTDLIPQQLRRPEVRPETPRTVPDIAPRSRKPEVRPDPRRPEVRPEPRVERGRPDPGPKNKDRGPPNKGNDKKEKKDKRD
jgi:hypothetical protein